MIGFPVTPRAETRTVTATSAAFALALSANERYLLISTVAAYIAQGASPTAAVAAAGSCYVPANTPFLVGGDYGAVLAIVRVSADGTATLVPFQF